VNHLKVRTSFAGTLRDPAGVLAPVTRERRAPGTLPIRRSPATTSSQARSAAFSKSGASAGRTCQPVIFFPSPIRLLISDRYHSPAVLPGSKCVRPLAKRVGGVIHDYSDGGRNP